jgi:hypothetical protein
MIIKRMNQDQKDVYNLQDTTDIVTDQQITEMNQILSTCEMKIEAQRMDIPQQSTLIEPCNL